MGGARRGGAARAEPRGLERQRPAPGGAQRRRRRRLQRSARSARPVHRPDPGVDRPAHRPASSRRRLRANFTADLTRPPAPPSRRDVHRWPGAAADQCPSFSPGGAALRITPQHFVPRDEHCWRGIRSKNCWTAACSKNSPPVAAEIRPGQALVIGYGLPLATASAVARRSRTPTRRRRRRRSIPPPRPHRPTTRPAPVPDLDVDPATLPLDLGRALLTAGECDFNVEQQRLLVITVLETR